MKVDHEENQANAPALVTQDVFDLNQAQLAVVGGGCGEVVWS